MHTLTQQVLRGLTAVAIAACLFSATAPGTAWAQSDLSSRMTRIEQDLQRLQKQLPPPAKGAAGTVAGAAAAGVDSSSDITVRILALERVVEQLTGQVEEAKFASDRTARQLQVLQDDLSLRVARIEQSLGVIPATPSAQNQVPPGVPAAAAAGATAPVVASVATTGNTVPPELRTPSSNAPISAPVASQPTARSVTAPATPPATLVPPAPTVPGVPVQVPATGAAAAAAVAANGAFVIRTDAEGRPLPPDPNAPQTPPPAAPEPSPQQLAPRAAPAPGPVSSAQVASLPGATVALPDGTPKQQYDFAFEFLKRQDYPKAESSLRDFLKKHPKDALAGNAQYWLGETYYVRGDFQQAAVEFMAGYQNYPKTNKGPDNLLKLGMSMAKLNQSTGACTALGRIAKDYPDAPAEVLTSAKTERTRLKCK